MSCEDYGLLYRLAANGQSPRVRVTADACPPIAATPGSVEGSYRVSDDGLGTVTLTEFKLVKAILSW